MQPRRLGTVLFLAIALAAAVAASKAGATMSVLAYEAAATDPAARTLRQ